VRKIDAIVDNSDAGRIETDFHHAIGHETGDGDDAPGGTVTVESPAASLDGKGNAAVNDESGAFVSAGEISGG
jgi:hypothetical protein